MDMAEPLPWLQMSILRRAVWWPRVNRRRGQSVRAELRVMATNYTSDKHLRNKD